MEVTDITVSSGDGSAGGVSSGDAVLPALPTVPEMVGDALEWYSPAAVEDTAPSVSVSADGDAGVEALLKSIDSQLVSISCIYIAILVVLGILCGIEFIKGFWIGRI